MSSERPNKTGMKKMKYCNNHVRQLSKPNKRLLMQTFRNHYPHFDIIRVEKIVVMLADKITPKEARRIIQMDRRIKIGSKCKKGLKEVEVIVEDLLNIFKLFICNNETVNLDSFEEQLSETVYLQLLNYLGIIVSFKSFNIKLITKPL